MISYEEADKRYIELFNSTDVKIDYKDVVYYVSEIATTVMFVIHYIPGMDENVMAIEVNTSTRMGLILEFNALDTKKQYSFLDIYFILSDFEKKHDLLNRKYYAQNLQE